MTTLDATLYRALHMTAGASGRWAALRATNPDDDAVLRSIGDEFGISGGFSEGAPVMRASYAGGKNPRLWVGTFERGKPSLQGPALVDATRRVLNLPQPVSETGQMELFA